MTTTDRYEEETRELLTQAQSELRTAENDMALLQDRMSSLVQEVKAYHVALHNYLRRKGRDVSAQPAWSELLKDCRNHKERIRAIARHKGGTMRVSELTDILFTEGFIQAQKRETAYTMVQSYLADLTEAGEVQKVAPGKYTLIGAQQDLLQ